MPDQIMTPQELTGRSRGHIVDLDVPRCAVHRDVAGPLLDMRESAARSGIDLVPVSGFRDFDRQLAIWNAKCRGERELLDRDGRPLSALSMNEEERVAAILHWSALPGASRHHWGTEIDVIDAAALPEDPSRLMVEDYAAGGIYSALDAWLAAHAAEFGFYRPYSNDRGGVQPEPWHLSFAPVSVPALELMSLELLRDALAEAGIEAPAVVTRRLPDIFERYVVNVDPPPASIPI
jgi:LAS superfamily LD-carboxypeptidase LdcB